MMGGRERINGEAVSAATRAGASRTPHGRTDAHDGSVLGRSAALDTGRLARSAEHDARIGALAASQHGVVERSQLLAAGVPDHVIEYRLKTRRMQLLHRSVYRVGPLTGVYEREIAAVLACGDGAVLSHCSAAAVWGMIAERRDARVDVSIPNGCCRAPGPGVRVHRSRSLPADEVVVRDGVRVTSAARTLLDIAGDVDSRILERAVALAHRQGVVDRESIVELLARHARRPGTRALRAIIGDELLPPMVRSEAERRFLTLIDRARLPAPEVNVIVKRYEVDCLWRAERLIAEIDGFAFHSSPEAFERDRRRDADLAGAGYRVIRVTWRQIVTESEALIAYVARALAMPSRM